MKIIDAYVAYPELRERYTLIDLVLAYRAIFKHHVLSCENGTYYVTRRLVGEFGDETEPCYDILVEMPEGIFDEVDRVVSRKEEEE